MVSDSYASSCEDDLLFDEELTPREKEIRDEFITYLLDCGDPIQAAIMVGYNASYARTFADKFMLEGYVLREYRRRQREDESSAPEFENPFHRDLWNRAHRMSMDKREQGAVRLGALRVLVNIAGLEKSAKQEIELTYRGGVMQVPGIASVEDWERVAGESQSKLVRESQ